MFSHELLLVSCTAKSFVIIPGLHRYLYFVKSCSHSIAVDARLMMLISFLCYWRPSREWNTYIHALPSDELPTQFANVSCSAHPLHTPSYPAERPCVLAGRLCCKLSLATSLHHPIKPCDDNFTSLDWRKKWLDMHFFTREWYSFSCTTIWWLDWPRATLVVLYFTQHLPHTLKCSIVYVFYRRYLFPLPSLADPCRSFLFCVACRAINCAFIIHHSSYIIHHLWLQLVKPFATVSCLIGHKCWKALQDRSGCS